MDDRKRHEERRKIERDCSCVDMSQSKSNFESRGNGDDVMRKDGDAEVKYWAT